MPSLATAKSRTWKTPTGAFETRVFGRAVNVKDAKGDWVAIDNSLSRNSAGEIVNGTGPVDLTLPQSLDGAVKVASGSDSISLSLQGAQGTPAALSGNTATYADVASGVDAKLTSSNAGLKEDLLLAGASAQNTFTYDVSLSSGLSLKERKDGGVDVVDGSGDVTFALAAPLAADAKGAVAPGASATMSVSGDEITVSLDRSWLQAAGRAFPVTLDPSTTMDASRDCYLDGANTTTSYCSSGDLWAGTSGGHDHKALTYFSVAGTVPEAANIQEANLHLYPLYQTSPGTAKTLAAHQVTSDWDGNATWVKRTAAANWTTAGGDIDATKLDPQPVPASGVWSDFTITDLVTSWLDGSKPNQGVAVTDDGSTANNTVVYASVDGADPNANPWLEIQWFPNLGALSTSTVLSQQISARQSVGVNVAGGNLLLQSSDLQVASTGLPVSIGRFYNSQDDGWNGTLGSKGRLSIGNDYVLYKCDHLESRCLIGPGGTRTRFSRNADGSFKTPAGIGNVTLSRATPTSGRFTLRENGSGVKYGFYDNDFSYVDTIDDRDGNHLGLEYHGTGNTLSKITDSRNRSYDVTSNSQGFITSISVPTSVIAGGQTWTYGYNPGDDLLTSVTDPEGNVTQYTYTTDGTDRLTKIHDARGNDTLIDYNSWGEVSAITRKIDGTVANDVKTTYAYIDSGFDSWCPTAFTTSGGVTSGGVTTGETTVTDPRGNATKYCWDRSGKVLAAKDPKGNMTSTDYNSVGNSSKFSSFYGGTSALGSNTTNYDPTGQNPTELKQSVSATTTATTTIGYPVPGTTPDPEQAAHATSVTEPNKNGPSAAAGAKNITNYAYDGNYHVTSVTSNTSSLKATLSYRSDGQIATAKDGNNGITTYGYNAIGELTSVAPPVMSPSTIGTALYTYDGVSRVKTYTDGRGKVLTYTYDKLGQIKSVTDSDGVVTSFVYDPNGNLTSRVTGTQTTSYVYDKLNRKTSETFPGSVANTYTYDKTGNLASLTDASGLVSYTYDQLNRTATVQSPGASSGTDTTSMTYNDPGSAGATPSTSNVVEQFTATGGTVKSTTDLSGKLTDVTVKTAGGSQTVRRTWAYDASIGGTTTSGELAYLSQDYGSAATPATSTYYAYGDNNQLTEAQTLNGVSGSNVRYDQFTYDPSGNRTKAVTTLGTGSPATTTYAYNADNELCWKAPVASTNTCAAGGPSGATSYTYDAAGNQLTGAATLAWDARGRLKSVGTDTVTHLSPTNNELISVGTQSYQNTVLGPNRITVAGSLAKIARDPGTGAAVSQVKDGVKRWFITDNLGSTIALVDSTGAVQRTYAYDTDGNDTTVAVGANPNPTTNIKYAGGHDIGSGLIHFGARYYQPSTGRWTQADPLDQPGDLGQMNRYLYVGNNPINGTDPSGQVYVSCDAELGGWCSRIRRWTGAAGKAATGCARGGWFGALRGSVYGAGAGCAVGAATGSGILGNIYNRVVKPAAHWYGCNAAEDPNLKC